jgi:hypothetical protein
MTACDPLPQLITLNAMTTLMALSASVQPLPPWQTDDEMTFDLLHLPANNGV